MRVHTTTSIYSKCVWYTNDEQLPTKKDCQRITKNICCCLLQLAARLPQPHCVAFTLYDSKSKYFLSIKFSPSTFCECYSRLLCTSIQISCNSLSPPIKIDAHSFALRIFVCMCVSMYMCVYIYVFKYIPLELIKLIKQKRMAVLICGRWSAGHGV